MAKKKKFIVRDNKVFEAVPAVDGCEGCHFHDTGNTGCLGLSCGYTLTSGPCASVIFKKVGTIHKPNRS